MDKPPSLQGGQPVPDPDRPGWMKAEGPQNGTFGTLYAPCWLKISESADGTRRAHCLIEVQSQHLNSRGDVHGGYLMGLVDQSLFIGAMTLGALEGPAVTLDASMQFLDRGVPGEPLESIGEILRTTGKLVFVRGVIEQGGRRIFAYSGTLRKISPPPGAPPFPKIDIALS